MKVEMTEREARLELSSKLRYIVSNIHWAAVVEAFGLEFAPEPLPVARELEDFGGWATFSGFHAWKRSPQGNAPFDVSETYAQGILRYNAYPGLRLAVEREIEHILHHHTAQYPYRADALTGIAERLRAELAKGPKS